MSMDPNKWVNTLPNSFDANKEEKSQLNPNIWVNTLPKLNSNKTYKKYFLSIFIFIIGLISVSIIKNETRILQKEINALQASINSIKFDLHQSTLDYEVITSPENISKLAKEYLDSDFSYYKQSQLKDLNEKSDSKILTEKKQKLTEEMKLKLAKKVKETKTELKKLQEIYSKPENIPKEVKIQIETKIKETKKELKQLYSDPKGAINKGKAQQWVVVQIVKAFLGIPMIPGR